MYTSKITRRLTVGITTVAAAGALAFAGAPVAAAAPVEAQPVMGSVALCFGVPLGSLSFNICI